MCWYWQLIDLHCYRIEHLLISKGQHCHWVLLSSISHTESAFPLSSTLTLRLYLPKRKHWMFPLALSRTSSLLQESDSGVLCPRKLDTTRAPRSKSWQSRCRCTLALDKTSVQRGSDRGRSYWLIAGWGLERWPNTQNAVVPGLLLLPGWKYRRESRSRCRLLCDWRCSHCRLEVLKWETWKGRWWPNAAFMWSCSWGSVTESPSRVRNGLRKSMIIISVRFKKEIWTGACWIWIIATFRVLLGKYIPSQEKQWMYRRNIEAGSPNHCCRGKAISITYCECECVCVCVLCVCVLCVFCVCVLCVCVLCVCSLGYPACNAHAPYCHKRPARLYHIFPHYLKNGMIFEQKLLNIKCVFWFSLQILSETFFIIRSVQRDIVINAHSSSCKVPVILVRF